MAGWCSGDAAWFLVSAACPAGHCVVGGGCDLAPPARLGQRWCVYCWRPPVAPAGLRDILDGKDEFKRLVAELWGGVDGRNVKSKSLGKGTVYHGVPRVAVLNKTGVAPDVAWPERSDDDEFRFIHRQSGDAEIYFLFNHSDRALSTIFNFRSHGLQPELWNPVTGTQVDAPVFTAGAEATAVPLQLEPYGSMFVVFRHALPMRWVESVTAAQLPAKTKSSPQIAAGIEMYNGHLLAAGGGRVSIGFSDGKKEIISLPLAREIEVNGPWRVTFLDGRGAPAETIFDKLISWSDHRDLGVKYYSGTAASGTGRRWRALFPDRKSPVLWPGFSGARTRTAPIARTYRPNRTPDQECDRETAQ